MSKLLPHAFHLSHHFTKTHSQRNAPLLPSLFVSPDNQSINQNAMDEPPGCRFVAALNAWSARLCSFNPPLEDLDAAIQKLDDIFDKKMSESLLQCPPEELETRLHHELELMEVEAKGEHSGAF